MVDSNLDFEQMMEIEYGLASGIDVNQYADVKYPAYQMSKIRKELETGEPHVLVAINEKHIKNDYDFATKSILVAVPEETKLSGYTFSLSSKCLHDQGQYEGKEVLRFFILPESQKIELEKNGNKMMLSAVTLKKQLCVQKINHMEFGL